MKLVLTIPEEFEYHFENDRFYDSLCRLKADANCMAGRYEKELADMLCDAFMDAQPVVTAKWILVDEKPYLRKHYHTKCCSNCFYEKPARKTKYCPNCGAEMDNDN